MPVRAAAVCRLDFVIIDFDALVVDLLLCLGHVNDFVNDLHDPALLSGDWG